MKVSKPESFTASPAAKLSQISPKTFSSNLTDSARKRPTFWLITSLRSALVMVLPVIITSPDFLAALLLNRGLRKGTKVKLHPCRFEMMDMLSRVVLRCADAHMAACVRFLAPSLRRIVLIRTLIVASAVSSFLAITLFVSPSMSCPRISSSRLEKLLLFMAGSYANVTAAVSLGLSP
jgi:hypothetical protein